MSTKQMVGRRVLANGRNVAWILVVGVAAAGLGAVARADQNGITNANCAEDFRDAAEAAMKSHVAITNAFYTQAAVSMQEAVSPDSGAGGNTASGILKSCLGNITQIDFDISSFIPDFGLNISNLIRGAINGLVNSVAGRVCNSIRNSTRTAVGSWNTAIAELNGQFNLYQRVLGAVNSQVPPINVPSSWYGNSSSGMTGGAGGSIYPPICIPTLNGSICTDGTSTTKPPGLPTEPPPAAASMIGQDAAAVSAPQVAPGASKEPDSLLKNQSSKPSLVKP